MYCPRCGYSLHGLPDIHRCPECEFIYVRNATTRSEPPPVYRLFQNVWGWSAVLLAFLGLAYLTVGPLYHFLGDGSIPWLGSPSDSSDPLLRDFDACFSLFFVLAGVVYVISEQARPNRFWIHSGGVGWQLRGGIDQLIPWSVISEAHLAADGKTITLDLTIGGSISVPGRVLKRLFTPAEAVTQIRQRLAESRLASACD